jgi:hypothetical protein
LTNYRLKRSLKQSSFKNISKRYVLVFIDTKKIITSSKTYACGLKILSNVNLDLCTVLDMIQKKIISFLKNDIKNIPKNKNAAQYE